MGAIRGGGAAGKHRAAGGRGAPDPAGAPDSAGAGLDALRDEIVACERCPRLRAHCAEMARVKVRRHRDEDYWGKPVPGFGDPGARLLLVGLAPAAHGGNRTGRVFTGDESGDWVFEALHRIGMANQPSSRHRGDGLSLHGAYVSAAARCAPPDNRPTPEELRRCKRFLERELQLLREVRVVLALGKIAFDAYLQILRDAGVLPAASLRGLRFAHGAEYQLERPLPVLLASYHPSRQNTYTRRLTREMWHAVFDRAREIAAVHPGPDGTGPRSTKPQRES